MRYFLILIMACCLSACASEPTTIELPDGSCYIITSTDNSVVNAQLDGVGTIGVDKTGGDSDFKWFLINAMNQTQINVGDGGND